MNRINRIKSYRFKFPKGMRPSTLKERKFFYTTDFDLGRVKKWLKNRKIEKTVFAVIIGRHSNIFLPEYVGIKDKAVIIDDHRSFNDVMDYILQYLPEGVYYDRNVYRELDGCLRCGKSYKDCWDCDNFLGQELAFDVDPENVRCPYHGSIGEKMERGEGLSFCMIEFKRVRKLTYHLFQELETEFRDLRVVFSGRGFHIHVLDKKARKMDREERKEIAKRYLKYAIDPWVTNGEMRLIRLPYSLNGLVSRVCLPIKSEEILSFDPRRKATPSFLL